MILPIQLIDIDGGCLIMVEAWLNGRQARMIVDTGASRTCIDPEWLARFVDHPQVEHREGQTVGVGGQQAEQQVVSIESFSIGDATLKDLEVAVVDLGNVRDFGSRNGLPDFVGIVGGDVLRRLRASISYRRRTLTVGK